MMPVLYSCPFVPAEWIEAHGARACRVVPNLNDGASCGAQTGMCPYARAFAGHVLSAEDNAAVVFTTTCDQMRRAAELVQRERRGPLFLMNVPATWQTPVAERMYVAELRRLGRFLRDLGAHEPKWERKTMPSPARSASEGSASEADPRLRDCRNTRLGGMGKRIPLARGVCRGRHGQAKKDSLAHATRQGTYSYSLLRFGLVRTVPLATRQPAPSNTVRLAVTGGPLAGNSSFHRQVEQAGGTIVLDATDSGERTHPAPIDRERFTQDLLGELARAYLAIPSIHQRPNHRLLAWLKHGIARLQVRGLILRRFVWCDLWHAESRRIADEAGVPVLDLQIDGDSAATDARTSSRIGGFIETLAGSARLHNQVPR